MNGCEARQVLQAPLDEAGAQARALPPANLVGMLRRPGAVRRGWPNLGTGATREITSAAGERVIVRPATGAAGRRSRSTRDRVALGQLQLHVHVIWTAPAPALVDVSRHMGNVASDLNGESAFVISEQHGAGFDEGGDRDAKLAGYSKQVVGRLPRESNMDVWHGAGAYRNLLSPAGCSV